MVKLKKQISIILILSLFLSLIPNFLYNERGRILANGICPYPDCKEVAEGEPCCDVIKKDGEKYCTNCPIPCEIETFTFTNKSCLPLEGTGEWICGKEIPIGEVMDRTTYLASRILAEFGGIMKGGRQMVDKTDELLTDYKDWSCQDWCQTGCYKRYFITAGVRQSECEQPEEWDLEISTSKVVYPEECNNDHTLCMPCAEYCAEGEHKERCCWPEFKEIEVPDPEHPGETIIETITCKYCRKEGSDPETGEVYCQEKCIPYSCMGCCSQYFSPIINGYTGMEGLQKALKNDIEETDSPKKFKRSYILEQLDFSRCELAQCWIPAGDYYDVLAGKKVGKHLLTCEQATQMGLFDDDQISCLTFQIINEWEEIIELWAEMEEASWWQKPIIFFEIVGRVIAITGRILWEMIKEWADTGQEEGCYPTNYYCCQM